MTSSKLRRLVTQLYTGTLSINLQTILDEIETKYEYDLFCEFIENYILDDYNQANVLVNITCGENDLTQITVFQFLINLYLLEFNFMYDIPITKEWMVDVDKNFLVNYHDEVERMCRKKIYPILKNYKKMSENEVYSFLLSHLTERMEQIAELLSTIVAPTLSINDITDFCNRNKEFNDILNTRLDSTKTYSQLEAELVSEGKRLRNVILNDKKSCLYPFVESNCLNQTQLTQMFVAVGPRMSANNVVMSHIMEYSYLNGLQNVGDLIAESEIASKALIYTKKFVGVSGYMSRETNLSCLNLRIDYNLKDCKTKHFIEYEVKTPKHLELIISKNMILPNGKLKEITEDDYSLVGTTIKLRTFTMCAHPERGLVCKTCYGNPPEFKKDYRIGGATSTEVENKLSNAVMSVKHQTGTKTKDFDNKEVLKYFKRVETQLVLKRLENAENISILFDKEYIEDILDRVRNNEDLDDDFDNVDEENQSTVASKMLTDLKIVTKTIDKMSGEEIEEEYEVKIDGSFLVLSEDMTIEANLKAIQVPVDSEVAILKLSDIKPGTSVFTIRYITAETSRYLKELKNIIERSKPTWYVNDLSTPIQAFADLIIEANLSNEELVFIEPIMYSLTRDPEVYTRRPDFSKDEVDFVVMNLKTSIFKGDLCSKLVYQEVTKTVKDIDSYVADGVKAGIHDTTFRTTIKQDLGYMKKALRKHKVI